MLYCLNESTDNAFVFTQKTGDDNPFKDIILGDRTAPSFGDINGDGKKDLVVGEFDGILNYYLNESTTDSIVFTEKTNDENPFNGVSESYSAPTFTDINGDGKTDLVMGEGDGGFKFYLNESTTDTIVFTEKTGNDNPFNGLNVGGVGDSTPIFADISGDGKLDLIAGASYGGVHFFLNESTTGTISFTQKTGAENPFNEVSVETASAPALIDIDGDGDLDLVLGESGGNIVIAINHFGTFILFV